MFTPIDFSNISLALDSPLRWIELALVVLCYAGGWWVDRRVSVRSSSEAGIVQVGLGGLNRVLLPLVTLLLLVVAIKLFRHVYPPFFLLIALPLTVALAIIRIIVYALRGVFGSATWLAASERVISFTIWGLALLYFTGVTPQISEELAGIVVPIGTSRITVLEILRSTLAIVLTVAVTVWLSSLIEQRLLRASNLDTSVRAVLSKSIRAVLLIAGVLFALQAVGIDLTLLSVFGGALGVGIGLGLQKLASNYIAGFAILLDRSIRLGDMITVDNRFGVVVQVTSRYCVVRSLDGVAAIVPNETLATTTVLNHTYTSKDSRVAIPVQVTYDSDIELALKLMAEAARAEPRTRSLPSAPEAYVARFGVDGVDLELGLWINDPENGQLGLRSAINRRIWTSFKANGIRIASPQREIRLVDGTGNARAGGVPTAAAATPAPPSAAPATPASDRP
jgi:small-conductance mechanosensitive channel